MSEDEKSKLDAALLEAVVWRCHFENCEPDVGIGPDAYQVVDSILEICNIDKSEVNYQCLIDNAHHILA